MSYVFISNENDTHHIKHNSPRTINNNNKPIKNTLSNYVSSIHLKSISTFIGVLLNLFILSRFNLPNVLVQIIFTITSISLWILSIIWLIIITNKIFNKNINDNKDITLISLLDVFTSYVISTPSVLMIFWVWFETDSFTLIGEWNTIPIVEMWIRFITISNLCIFGGTTLYISNRPYTEIVTAIICYISFLVESLVLGVGVSIILDNISSENKKNIK